MMIKSVFAVTVSLLTTPVSWASDSLAYSTDSTYQQLEMRRLFAPTEAELRHEATGKIYIYEGLTEHAIAEAMQGEFDRVEHMMFVNTIRTDSQGQPMRHPETGIIEADSDCD